MMNKLLIALIVCYTGVVNAQDNAFVKFFSSFESLGANFKQTTYNEAGVLLANASGHLLFAYPKQLLWHTAKPNKQTLLLNKNEIWLIDFELEQASLQPSNNLEETPLYWLTNRPNTINHLPQYVYTKDGLDWYSTEQKNELRFGFQNNGLHTIKLTNELGQRLVLSFSELTLNPNIDKNIFDLKLGPTFDVIR